MGNALSQCFFIPPPPLTEKNLPSQAGKVFIVTGGYAGCGYELAGMLYAAGGTVYIAGRNASKGAQAISTLKSAHQNSHGRLDFLSLDLSDLRTIKPAVAAFLARETRLDVLTNNAGVMVPPLGSQDAHGHELQIGTNCLGAFLLTKLLLPVLLRTAASAAPGAVRVTWAGSLAMEINAPKGGMKLDAGGAPAVLGNREVDYAQSKVGNMFLASEAARRYGKQGLVSVCWNPGNLRTELQRHMQADFSAVYNWLVGLLLYEQRFGGYTELSAAVGEHITPAQNGCYVAPWGRVGSVRKDITMGLKNPAEGGNGAAEKFWEWCERETAEFA